MAIWTQDLQIFPITIFSIAVDVIYFQMNDTIYRISLSPSAFSAGVIAFF